MGSTGPRRETVRKGATKKDRTKKMTKKKLTKKFKPPLNFRPRQKIIREFPLNLICVYFKGKSLFFLKGNPYCFFPKSVFILKGNPFCFFPKSRLLDTFLKNVGLAVSF